MKKLLVSAAAAMLASTGSAAPAQAQDLGDIAKDLLGGIVQSKVTQVEAEAVCGARGQVPRYNTSGNRTIFGANGRRINTRRASAGYSCVNAPRTNQGYGNQGNVYGNGTHDRQGRLIITPREYDYELSSCYNQVVRRYNSEVQARNYCNRAVSQKYATPHRPGSTRY